MSGPPEKFQKELQAVSPKRGVSIMKGNDDDFVRKAGDRAGRRPPISINLLTTSLFAAVCIQALAGSAANVGV